MLKRILCGVLMGMILTVGLALGGCGEPKTDIKAEAHEEINVEETVETRMVVE